MATERLKTIKSSSGDYTSLSAAEAGEDDTGDLVSRDEWMHFSCYSMEDTAGTVNITGWTTDATRYILVDTPSSERHDGKWNTSKYRLSVANADVLLPNEKYIRIDGLQVELSSANANGQDVLSVSDTEAGAELWISNCIFKAAISESYWNYGVAFYDLDLSTVRMWNSVVIAGGIWSNNNNAAMYVRSANAYLANIIVYGGYYGLRSVSTAAGTYKFRNCVSYNTNGADFVFATGPTYDVAYCVSEDLTADDKGGDGNKTGQDLSSTFVDAANGDFHLQSTDTVLKDAGVSLASDADWGSFSTDIDGQARSGSWDIGADEYVSSGITLTMSSGAQKNAGDSSSIVWEALLGLSTGGQQNISALGDIPLQTSLATENGIQSNVADVPGLFLKLLAELASGVQANVGDDVNIRIEVPLSISDGIQTNVGDVITLVIEGAGTEYTLTMFDGANKQIGDAVSLNIEGLLGMFDGVNNQVGEAISLNMESLLGMAGGIQKNQDNLYALTTSVTLSNMRLSLADGVAFIDVSSAGILTDHIGSKIIVTDSAGKRAVGYIKAAGTGETYGSEQVTNGGFDSDAEWTYVGSGWSISGGKAVATGASVAFGSQMYQLLFYGLSHNGKLLRSQMTVSDYVAGQIDMMAAFVRNTMGGADGTYTLYGTVQDNGAYAAFMAKVTDLTCKVDNYTSKQVLTPSATGVTIVSTPGGSTYNWTSIESGFDYNDTNGYTICFDNLDLIINAVMSALSGIQKNAGDAITDIPLKIIISTIDGIQKNYVDVPVLTIDYLMSIAGGAQLNVSDSISLLIEAILSAIDGIQINVGDTVTLSVSMETLARLLRIISCTPKRSIESRTPEKSYTVKTATKTIQLIGG